MFTSVSGTLSILSMRSLFTQSPIRFPNVYVPDATEPGTVIDNCASLLVTEHVPPVALVAAELQLAEPATCAVKVSVLYVSLAILLAMSAAATASDGRAW